MAARRVPALIPAQNAIPATVGMTTTSATGAVWTIVRFVFPKTTNTPAFAALHNDAIRNACST